MRRRRRRWKISEEMLTGKMRSIPAPQSTHNTLANFKRINNNQREQKSHFAEQTFA